MDYIETVITLQPGPLREAAIRELLGLVFDKWGWFEPALVGRVTPDQALPEGPVVDSIMERWDGGRWLGVGSTGERDLLIVNMDKGDERSHLGQIAWYAPLERGQEPHLRDEHAEQVAALMKRLDSPYGYAGESDGMREKTHRETTDDRGFTIETYTVRDHSEGLAGLFWRNFFGRPFQQLFGDTLGGVSRDLGGIALLEPYPTPELAATEEGRRREAELIHLLGTDCFYDHQRQVLPSRRPVLPT